MTKTCDFCTRELTKKDIERLTFEDVNYTCPNHKHLSKIEFEHDKVRIGSTGYIIETKNGYIGKTFYSKKTIQGKLPVYLENGLRMLCDFKTIKVIGFHQFII